MMSGTIGFFDLEVDGRGRILDIGAVVSNQRFHSSSIAAFANLVKDCDYLCGHNIIEHDLKYISSFLTKDYVFILSF